MKYEYLTKDEKVLIIIDTNNNTIGLKRWNMSVPVTVSMSEMQDAC